MLVYTYFDDLYNNNIKHLVYTHIIHDCFKKGISRGTDDLHDDDDDDDDGTLSSPVSVYIICTGEKEGNNY